MAALFQRTIRSKFTLRNSSSTSNSFSSLSQGEKRIYVNESEVDRPWVPPLPPLGAGRGKPIQPPAAEPEKPTTENRHIRPQPHGQSPVAAAYESSPREQLSQEEKVKKAVGILSKGDQVWDGTTAVRAGGGGRRASGRGRGRGRGRGEMSSGRGRGRGDDRYEESDDEGGLFIGDPADGEKVAEKLGPVIMDKLAEGVEEMASRVLPSPLDDAFLDAFETNLRIEFEPEYLMEEFGTNPDIDEKPPIPLRDALEKMKPFLVAYEGIKSQEEWEEVIEETMKQVPLIKEIVDHYSGPDRVTAKEQQEELERVAKTLPASAPASVKRFTDRALLTLQSNPGWGFNKKCQFMDEVIMEVSQQYKCWKDRKFSIGGPTAEILVVVDGGSWDIIFSGEGLAGFVKNILHVLALSLNSKL